MYERITNHRLFLPENGKYRYTSFAKSVNKCHNFLTVTRKCDFVDVLVNIYVDTFVGLLIEHPDDLVLPTGHHQPTVRRDVATTDLKQQQAGLDFVFHCSHEAHNVTV